MRARHSVCTQQSSPVFGPLDEFQTEREDFVYAKKYYNYNSYFIRLLPIKCHNIRNF